MHRERPEMYQALGRTIQVMRTDQGLERKELAERAGISYSYLAAIENGKKPPSSKVLFAIADALGLRSHELLGAAETRHQRGGHHRSARGSWFHSESEVAPMAAASGPPPMDAFADEMAEPVGRRSVPRSPSGFLIEIERLSLDMDEEDRELLLHFARRLAERRR